MRRAATIPAALAATALTLALATPAMAGTTTFVEDFENMSNEGGWTWGFGDTFVNTGGNPGAYFATAGLDTFAPRPSTTTGGIFVGDYRAKGVVSFGIDLNTFAVDFSAGDRPATLMLIYNNGTPGDPFDDTAAYVFGPNVPLAGQGWISYDYDIPSQETDLPAGWMLLNLGDSGAPANHTWDQVIQSVSQVQIFYGDPTFFFIFQQWQLGMDNPRLTTDGNGGGTGPFVTICHHPPGNQDNSHTITVGSAALPAHLAHGDTMGPCSNAAQADRTSGEAARTLQADTGARTSRVPPGRGTDRNDRSGR